MKRNLILILCLGAACAQSQQVDTEKLSKQLKQLEETVQKQQAQIDELKRQLEAGKTNLPPPVPPSSAAAQPIAAPEPSRPSVAAPQAAWSPSQPIRVGTAQNYIGLSFDGLFAAGTSTARDIDGGTQLGGHDPKQRGFTVQNLEATFDGKVDPYFRGQANLVLQIDPGGETHIEAEEAYLETMSLPFNLQLKGGQFFTEFGRLNPTHPHTWDFVDQPLVNGRFLGEDGLRNPGVRLSWLMPTPFYSELYLAVQNSQGATAHSFRSDHEDELFLGRPATDTRVRNFGDMLFAPRYAASFDITDAQTIVAGASAAFGPNSTGNHVDTQIYGVDLFWKWKSPQHHAGFPFVTWQTEAMMRRFDAGAFPGDLTTPPLPEETLKDYGIYSQVAWGFTKGWVTALRGDYLFPDEKGRYEDIVGSDPDRASRWRISPNLTWYPSEFSKVRLQYNFDHRNIIGDDHSVWLQFEFLLGSHAAHKF